MIPSLTTGFTTARFDGDRLYAHGHFSPYPTYFPAPRLDLLPPLTPLYALSSASNPLARPRASLPVLDLVGIIPQMATLIIYNAPKVETRF